MTFLKELMLDLMKKDNVQSELKFFESKLYKAGGCAKTWDKISVKTS